MRFLVVVPYDPINHRMLMVYGPKGRKMFVRREVEKGRSRYEATTEIIREVTGKKVNRRQMYNVLEYKDLIDRDKVYVISVLMELGNDLDSVIMEPSNRKMTNPNEYREDCELIRLRMIRMVPWKYLGGE